MHAPVVDILVYEAKKIILDQGTHLDIFVYKRAQKLKPSFAAERMRIPAERRLWRGLH
ncbi:hypothetical protein [Microvirga sp. TS319]|uniref:hypothetical protein n=1 Tax=Microvirga sp. TS319 TaxID=3241165 RepID=UPI00351A16DD